MTVIYRRTREEMPAHHEELMSLLHERIPIRELAAPKAIVVENGRVKGLRCATMKLGEPDASGRKRPVEVPGADFTLELEVIIAAIGQQPFLDFLKSSGIEFNRKGYIVADADGLTSAENIFAGGDAVNDGPLSLVKAEGDGKRIAAEILRRVAGVEPAPEPMRCTGGLDLPAELRKQGTRLPRVEIPELPLTARKGLDEVIQTMSTEVAQAEAARCMRCDRFCSLCTSVCPNQAFLTYESKPFSAELATWTVQGGQVVAGKRVKFAAVQAYQTAVLTDYLQRVRQLHDVLPDGRPALCGQAAPLCFEERIRSAGATTRSASRVRARAARLRGVLAERRTRWRRRAPGSRTARRGCPWRWARICSPCRRPEVSAPKARAWGWCRRRSCASCCAALRRSNCRWWNSRPDHNRQNARAERRKAVPSIRNRRKSAG